MIKLLIGGSPCTYWSCAQKNNRETEPSGMGWELFKNYLIAKEKFKPDLFLYENNKSAAQAIKDEIKKQFGVWDGTFLTEDTGARYIEINSALVSAQNRQRFYVHNCGEVGQPEDRGILLRDILESNGNRIPKYTEDKSRPLTATYKNKGSGEGSLMSDCFPDNPNKQVFDYIAEPVNVTADGKAQTIKAQYQNTSLVNICCYKSTFAEPIRIGDMGSKAQAHSIYSIDGKSVCINSGGGGLGAKTGLYAIPTDKLVYEVRNGLITIKDKQYPIKLKDGYYIMRKLTVTECCRLQGMPDWWFLDKDGNKILSDSQAYKGLGNGWQLDTVKYILEHGLRNIPRNEEIVVLSMYDGIGTGRRILEELGFTNVKYYAYEIDKYCIKLTSYRYPDIVHCGDAFNLRNENWSLENYAK